MSHVDQGMHDGQGLTSDPIYVLYILMGDERVWQQ